MKINVTPEEFTSIMMIYFLDKLNNLEELRPHTEEFEKIWSKMDKLKAVLTQFYLNTDINNRIYYKRLRDVFEEKNFSQSYIINIVSGDLNENEILNEEKETDVVNKEEIEFYKIKEIIKKVINLINKRRFYKGRYLSDKEMDKIINKVLEENK